MRRTRLRMGAAVQAGDRVRIGGVWYAVRTAVSDRNGLRHFTGRNEVTGRSVKGKLDPVQDFEVEREEEL
jgi:hypothetical protein